MKRICIFTLTAALVIGAMGCGKDHDAPTFSKYGKTDKPTNVIATYSKTTNTFSLQWDMADTSGVVAYKIAISDSSLFDSGTILERVSNSTDTEAITEASFIPASVDSTILYFKILAVYKTTSLNLFAGPWSDSVDSAMVYRN